MSENSNRYNAEIKKIVDEVEQLAFKISKETDSIALKFVIDCTAMAGTAVTNVQVGGLAPKQDPKKVAEDLLRRTLENRDE